MISGSVLYQIFLLLFNIVLFLCMMFLTVFVLMWSWFIVWLLIVFSEIYSYNLFYILGYCALGIDEIEISVCMNIHQYIMLWVSCVACLQPVRI